MAADTVNLKGEAMVVGKPHGTAPVEVGSMAGGILAEEQVQVAVSIEVGRPGRKGHLGGNHGLAGRAEALGRTPVNRRFRTSHVDVHPPVVVQIGGGIPLPRRAEGVVEIQALVHAVFPLLVTPVDVGRHRVAGGSVDAIHEDQVLLAVPIEVGAAGGGCPQGGQFQSAGRIEPRRTAPVDIGGRPVGTGIVLVAEDQVGMTVTVQILDETVGGIQGG